MIDKTQDINMASVLTSLGFDLLDFDNTDKKNCIFSFEETPRLKSVINMFWNKKLMIEPTSFFAQLRLLRSRIFDDLN